MFDFFQYSFMVRALVAGSAVALVLGWLGTFIVTRKMSFIGDGLAHASLAGIALAILVGWAPLPTAVLVSVLLAVVIYYLEKKTNVSSDMAIAIIFTSGMALGLIMLHYYQGYQPELMSYLFGNILAISQFDFYFISIASAIILALLVIFHRLFLFATFDPIGAQMAGKKPGLYDLLLYIMTAVAIILSIKLVGIILVSALLVVPSAISRLFANSFTQFIVLAVISAIVIMSLGLFASYHLDWPSGATIILTGTLLFVLAGVFKKISS
ncbi:MAG TPA: metal ABC transporter permease [Patescibacteria group bacterium]|nr:metal ABC transporter permease [Patescibacteria group bacterium]